MPFLPFNILGFWFRGFLSIAILAGGIYLLARWYDESHIIVERPIYVENADPREPTLVAPRRVFHFDPGMNKQTFDLAAALALLTWATMGRIVGNGVRFLRPGVNAATAVSTPESRKARRRKAKQKKTGQIRAEEEIDPTDERTGKAHSLARPDGSILHIECYGPPDAPPIIWTHGWGASSTEWFYQKRYLADRFRLIVWDEPGLGLSLKPKNNDYRLDNLAADLHAVLAFAGDKPALLVGHSIGGMITLTLCKEYPESLSRVAGLVLAHTTYTNPVRTTHMAGLYTAIEKPVIIPLLYLTIGLWPLAWLLNWMSYFNGSVHRSTHKGSFSGNETRGQLDFVAGYMPHARPDVLARGMLGMIAYDATNVLPHINVPTLVFIGDQDTSTSPEAGEFIASNIPNAELITLSPAKHMGLFEHHDRFDQLVTQFADSCLLARTTR
jgi:pimeloyl-ACP methyl ester carboxylesterase